MSPAASWVRATFFCCAVILAVPTLCLVGPQFSRHWPAAPSQAAISSDLSLSGTTAAQQTAWLPFNRGVSWSELAMSYKDLVSSPNPGGAQSPTHEALQKLRHHAERALRHSPHNSRLWLLLAALELRMPQGDAGRAAAAVKMAYYTGPGELELVPLRLAIALQPQVLAEQEIQQLVRQEFQTILSRKPELKPVILAAYRRAGVPAQKFIEDSVSTQDPEFLKSARSEASFR